jgi:hypothetical protein
MHFFNYASTLTILLLDLVYIVRELRSAGQAYTTIGFCGHSYTLNHYTDRLLEYLPSDLHMTKLLHVVNKAPFHKADFKEVLLERRKSYTYHSCSQ